MTWKKRRTPTQTWSCLQSRDVELDAVGPGYTDYSVCANETEHPDLCKLRVALDRIFWKGDFLEYVAVNGKSLKNMLAESEEQNGATITVGRYRHVAGVAYFLRHCAVCTHQHY